MSFQANERIGEYILHEKLGEGAFGEVWKAEQEITKKTVALKVLKKEADVASFIRESEVIHGMQHRHIVGVVGGSLRHERPHIAMELVDGGSLHDMLIQKGKLPASEAINILRDVADAVGYAHGQGFLHRDLKPGNILIDNNGRAKVCDFGLGRAVEKESLDSLRSADGIVGTLDYMSPEQMRGEDVDARSDIYSLGRVLFHMVAGHVPKGMDENLLEYSDDAHAHDVDAIFRQCCARPENRYADGEALRKDIEAVLAGKQYREIHLTSDSMPEVVKTGKGVGAMIFVLMAAAVILLVVVIVRVGRKSAVKSELPLETPPRPTAWEKVVSVVERNWDKVDADKVKDFFAKAKGSVKRFEERVNNAIHDKRWGEVVKLLEEIIARDDSPEARALLERAKEEELSQKQKSVDEAAGEAFRKADEEYERSKAEADRKLREVEARVNNAMFLGSESIDLSEDDSTLMIQRYQEVIDRFPGTPQALEAARRIKIIKKEAKKKTARER